MAFNRQESEVVISKQAQGSLHCEVVIEVDAAQMQPTQVEVIEIGHSPLIVHLTLA